jgi:hypothetical protein
MEDGSLAFQEIVLPEWRLGSADSKIRIRLLVYDSRARCLRVDGVAITSLTELQEMDPLSDVLPIMSSELDSSSPAGTNLIVSDIQPSAGGDYSVQVNSQRQMVSAVTERRQVGHFVLQNAEPAAFGGVFTLKAVSPSPACSDFCSTPSQASLRTLPTSAMSQDGSFEGPDGPRPNRSDLVGNLSPARMQAGLSSGYGTSSHQGYLAPSRRSRDLASSSAPRAPDMDHAVPLSLGSANFWMRSRSPVAPVMSPFGRPSGTAGTTKYKDRSDGARSPSPLHCSTTRPSGAMSGRLKPAGMRSFGSCYESRDSNAGLIRKSSQPFADKVQADMRAPRQESAPGGTADARRTGGVDLESSAPASHPRKRHVLRLVGFYRDRRHSSAPR